MKPIALRSVKPLRLVALTVVAAAVTHVIGLPAFIDAIRGVGTDMQMPLERMATDAPDASEPSTRGAPRVETPAPATSATQLTSSKDALRPRAAHRTSPLAPGYRHSVSDSKYWT